MKLRRAKHLEVKSVESEAVFVSCNGGPALQIPFGSALSLNRLESRTRDGWQLRRKVVKQELFKSLIVSDVVKSASASHYGCRTFGLLCVDFRF